MVRVYNGVSAIGPELRGAVLTVGNFDGVHLGHQRILRTARALAQVSKAALLVMTFDPHPLTLLRPGQAPAQLTTWEEKLRQLEHLSVDAVVRLETDWPLLSLTAEDFVREVLVRRIHPSYIVEGPSFGFGRDRRGTVNMLNELSSRGGFQVHVVEPYRLSGADGNAIVVSSTLVRAALDRGDVRLAAQMLGRPYAMMGTVVHGAGAGRMLGYPTINLDIGSQMCPGEAVYAGVAEIGLLKRAAAISIGRRPTFGGGALSVEAFILDESADWYGSTARLELAERLRGQVKFESLDALRAQITIDVQAVRAIIDQDGGSERSA